jgi:ceramide glucosyltransferase
VPYTRSSIISVILFGEIQNLISNCYDVSVNKTELLHIVLIVLVVTGCMYTLLSIFCVSEFFKPKNRDTSEISLIPVSVLKPLKGRDPDFKENILSFCGQEYPEYEVLLGFTDPEDEAIAEAEEIVSSQKNHKVRIVISQSRPGVNQKVSNMQGLVEAARYPLVALSDSDMRVDKDFLGKIVRDFLSHENVGLVTSLYKISSPRSLGAALESLSLLLDFIPSVLVARRLEGMTFGLGASILVSKKALDEIGGLSVIADYLADDYQIGNRIWKKGHKIILSRYVLEDVVGNMSLTGHLVHQLRWARTYRASRPKGYLGYGITHVLTFALVFLAWYGPTVYSLALVGGVLFLRSLLAFVIYKKVIAEKKWLRWLVLLPIKDMLSFFIWCWSFLGRKVYWRGRYYRLLKGGKIVSCR